MKKLTTILLAGILFSACQKNSNESFKDQLTTEEKIVIPAAINPIVR